MNNKTLLIAVVCIIIVAVAAVGAFIVLDDDDDDNKTVDPTPAPTPSQDVYPVTVTDGIGNTVTLKAAPTRIVASNQGLDLMSWLGQGYWDLVVGCPYDVAAHLDWWYAPNTHDFSKVATLSDSDNMYQDGEKILTLKPDLVIIYGGSASANENANKLVSFLAKADIQCFVINNDSSQYKTAESYIERNLIPMSKLFNASDRAQALYDQVVKWQTDLTNRLSGITADKMKYVYVAGGSGKAGTYFLKSSWSTFYPTMILDKYVYNIMHDISDAEVYQLDYETLYNYEKNTHKIDAVFVCSKVFPVWSQEVKENKDRFTAISAISEGEIYGIPQTMARCPDATIIDSYAIASYLYPELFSDFDINAFALEVWKFFMNDDTAGQSLYNERLEYQKETVGMSGLFEKIDMSKF